MRADGYASRAGGVCNPDDVLSGLTSPRVAAPRLLCGQCGKRLDDADETLTCYCRDVAYDEKDDTPWAF